MGFIATTAIFVAGIAYYWVAYIGFHDWLGPVWATIIITACFFFRLTWITGAGVFLCAYYVFDWHWFWAAVLAVPMLLVIPLGIATIFSNKKIL